MKHSATLKLFIPRTLRRYIKKSQKPLIQFYHHLVRKKIWYTLIELFYTPIIQFSPPRTGSTLIYNVLREIFPHRRIIKLHILKNKYSTNPIVSTYRHPIDSLASSFLLQEQKNRKYALKEVIENFDESIDDLLQIKDQSNVLLLRYESFYNNQEYIFDKIEFFFGKEISHKKRKKIKENNEIKKIKEKADKLRTFNKYDKKNFIHGKHISNYKGKPGYYTQVFTKQEIKELQSRYQYVINELNY